MSIHVTDDRVARAKEPISLSKPVQLWRTSSSRTERESPPMSSEVDLIPGTARLASPGNDADTHHERKTILVVLWNIMQVISVHETAPLRDSREKIAVIMIFWATYRCESAITRSGL